jgi:DNA-binding MltR family transcriptional regulator
MGRVFSAALSFGARLWWCGEQAAKHVVVALVRVWFVAHGGEDSMAGKGRSRGRKSETRADLIRLISSVPDGQTIFTTIMGFSDNFWELSPEKDRAAAIMGATFIEHALKRAIITKFAPDSEDPEFSYAFDSGEAPYRELASRIRLARALGIIDKNQYDNLESIRNIRNVFAHSMENLTFSTPQISAYFDGIVKFNEDNLMLLVEAFAPKLSFINALPSSNPSRMVFAQAVFLYYWKLMTYPGQNYLASLTDILKVTPSQ